MSVDTDGGSFNQFHLYYEPKEVLGHGLSSVVRKCVKKSTKQEFAVKVIDLNNLETTCEEARSEALRELRVLRLVQGHPHVIGLSDFYETDAYVFFVFEICPNGELFEHLNKVVRLTEKRTRTVIRQLLAALQFLHEKFIVHRDIKAENILLDDSMNVKLTDFGFATEVENDYSLRELCGTPSYLSPELLIINMNDSADCKGYGRAVDMWASGVLMYTMLSGSPPFWHRKQMLMLRMIMEGRFNFNSPEWEEISDSAKHVIRSLLTVDPKRRLTATEALQHPFFAIQPEHRLDNVQQQQQQQQQQPDQELPRAPFNARTRFRSAILAVRCLCRMRRMRAAPSRLDIRRLRTDPYTIRGMRRLIDNTAFLIYNHWVKKAEDQNRAALFETTPKMDLAGCQEAEVAA